MKEILRLKPSNCKNCYKCIRHRPVKAIRFSAGQAHVVGDHVNRLMEPDAFQKVRGKRKPLKNERTYLTEYECFVDRTILYNSDCHLYICILRDVTDEMSQQEKKMEMRMQAVEIADDVAKKQLKIVQDIASLLGETAADTLIAINRLKETISDD